MLIASDPTAEESRLIHDWQNENTLCRNATDEAECFLRWVRFSIQAERERLGCTGAVMESSGNHKPRCTCRACEYWKKHVGIIQNGYRSELSRLRAIINHAADALANRGNCFATPAPEPRAEEEKDA